MHANVTKVTECPWLTETTVGTLFVTKEGREVVRDKVKVRLRCVAS